MKSERSPFQTAWMSFDLGEARPCDGTYCFYAYDSLPPIPDEATFTGNFEWLDFKSKAHVADASLKHIEAEAQRLGIPLPAGFGAFMGDSALQDSFPSCTACTFGLSENFIPARIEEGGYFLRFMNDQQDVLMWYLYFSPTGEHCVVVSNILYDDEEYFNDLPTEAIKNSSGYCAPSFEAFLYRIWLENKIWFSMNEGETTDKLQEAYLAHYL